MTDQNQEAHKETLAGNEPKKSKVIFFLQNFGLSGVPVATLITSIASLFSIVGVGVSLVVFYDDWAKDASVTIQNILADSVETEKHGLNILGLNYLENSNQSLAIKSLDEKANRQLLNTINLANIAKNQLDQLEKQLDAKRKDLALAERSLQLTEINSRANQISVDLARATSALSEANVVRNAFALDEETRELLSSRYDLKTVAEDTLFMSNLGPNAKSEAFKYLSDRQNKLQQLRATHLRLRDLKFEDIVWSRSDFSNAIFEDISFTNGALDSIRLDDSSLSDVKFFSGGASRATFRETTLNNVEFDRFPFLWSRFDESELQKVRFFYNMTNGLGLHGVGVHQGSIVDTAVDHIGPSWVDLDDGKGFPSAFVMGFSDPKPYALVTGKYYPCYAMKYSDRESDFNISGVKNFSLDTVKVHRLAFNDSYLRDVNFKNVRPAYIQTDATKNGDDLSRDERFADYAFYSVLFADTVLCRGTVQSSEIPGLRVQGSIIDGVRFDGSMMWGSVFSKSEFHNIEIANSDLSGGHWWSNWFVNLKLSNVNLSKTSWAELYFLGETELTNITSIPSHVRNIYIRGQMIFRDIPFNTANLDRIKQIAKSACHLQLDSSTPGVITMMNMLKLEKETMQSNQPISITWTNGQEQYFEVRKCSAGEFDL